MFHPRLALVVVLVGGAACGDNLHRSSNTDAPTADGTTINDAPLDAPAPCVPATVHPVVESITSGDLVIGAADNENTVPLTPALERSVLFTSMSEIEASPAFGAVNCNLLLTGIDCKRTSPGTDVATSTGVVTIHWTVATFTSGVAVQRGVADTNVTNPSDAVLAPAIDPTKSFVVLNGVIGGGSGWGNNEFTHARIVDGTTLEIAHNAPGAKVSWQVVTMDGASVQRGTAAFVTNVLTQTATLTTPVSAGALLLSTYTTDNPSSFAAGSLMLQAGLASSTQVKFDRILPGVALDVAWEVASLPVLTKQVTTDFAAGEGTKTTSLAGITATSTVGVATNQAVLGSSNGSTAYAGADTDLLGEAAATFSVADGAVTVRRASTQSTASITWTIIDFSRDRCTGM